MKKALAAALIATLFIFGSCDNNEPISGPNINEDTFEVDSELFLLMERVSDEASEENINCIDFNYSFLLFIFDENHEYVEALNITDDQKFSDVLGALDEGYSISIQYPITGTLDNGDLIEINTNEELKEAIDACVRIDEQGRCNGSLVMCYWSVSELPGFPNDFEGDEFSINEEGFLQFHVDQEIYFGTWFSFFIGNELHLNITFVGEGSIADFWNHDWNVITLTDTLIEIETGDQRIRIEQSCAIDCALNVFEVCENVNNPGFASFPLQDYAICVAVHEFHDGVDPVIISFFETEIDAQQNINEISASNYNNAINPQTIFVRIADLELNETLGYTSITIEAITCDGG